MSDTPNTDANATEPAKPAKPRKPKSSHVTLSSVYAKKAAMLGTDTTKAAKLVRQRMRANFDTVCKLSPNVKTSKKRANDGNRWPQTITRKAAEFVLSGK